MSHAPNFRHECRPYQRAIFDEHCDGRPWGLLHEQGLGKTKVAIDAACAMHLGGLIDAMLVVAPGGVEAGWVRDELPKHVWESVPHQVFRYASSKAKTKASIEGAEDIVRARCLAILVMTYDGFMTDAGKDLAKKFLTKRKVMMVLDESQMIKNPNAKRTKTIVSAGKYAAVRWILSGTPQPNQVDDLYSQIRYLDPEFWKRRDIATVGAFRARFIITEPRGAPGRQFHVVVGHRDLDLLNAWLREISHRLTKAEALPDLPPKVYAKRYFRMTDTQERAYRELQKELRALVGLPPTEAEISALNPMVRMLRLQQIAGGYVPHPDDPEQYVEIDASSENARLRALQDEVESIESDGDKKIIIWYRFKRDGDLICTALGKAAVRYDGTVGDRDREAAIAAFRRPIAEGGARYFCANPAAIGRGVTLNEASDVIYYSNSHNGEHRWQSEDRCHRIGQEAACVRYVDVVAEGTVDSRITDNLRAKKILAQLVLGDEPTEWN